MQLLSFLPWLFLLLALVVTAILIIRNKLLKKNFLLNKNEIEKFKSIFEQANDGVLVVDIANGHIYQANSSLFKMLGYERESFEKLSIFDIHPSEYLNKIAEAIVNAWEKGGLVYKDIPFKTSNGELLPVECSAKVFPYGKRPAIVIYVRDIRERLRLEKEINDQIAIIDQKNKDILDSIQYAKRIQIAILFPKEEVYKVLPQSFILYKPKDIVSGDFYYFATSVSEFASDARNDHEDSGNEVIIAACDCTGHGVPGAFMSMIGNDLLNQLVVEKKITDPATILKNLHEGICFSLHQHKEKSTVMDGMDIALCKINIKNRVIHYAGAKRPVYIVRASSNNHLTEIKADKAGIGGEIEIQRNFTNHAISLNPGDSIYMVSDGYVDQFGGPKGKKYSSKRFREFLIKIKNQTMKEQCKSIETEIEDWKGQEEQTDDILVIGIQL